MYAAGTRWLKGIVGGGGGVGGGAGVAATMAVGCAQKTLTQIYHARAAGARIRIYIYFMQIYQMRAHTH